MKNINLKNYPAYESISAYKNASKPIGAKKNMLYSNIMQYLKDCMKLPEFGAILIEYNNSTLLKVQHSKGYGNYDIIHDTEGLELISKIQKMFNNSNN